MASSPVNIDDGFDVFFDEAADVIEKLQDELEKEKELSRRPRASLEQQLVAGNAAAAGAQAPEDDNEEWTAQMQADGRYPAYFESLQRQAAFWLATSTATTEDLNAFNDALKKLAREKEQAVEKGFHLDTLIRMAARQLRRLLLVYPATREEQLFIRTFNCGRSAPFFETTSVNLVALLAGFIVVVTRSPTRVMARQLSVGAFVDLLKSVLPLLVVSELERKLQRAQGAVVNNDEDDDTSKRSMLKNLLKVLATSTHEGSGGEAPAVAAAATPPAPFNVDRTTYLSALLRLFITFQAELLDNAERNSASINPQLPSAADTEPAHLYNIKVAELLGDAVTELQKRVEQHQQKLEEMVDLDRLLFELHKFYEFYEEHNRAIPTLATQLLLWNHHFLGSIQTLLDLMLEVKGEDLWEHIGLIEQEVVSSSSGRDLCRHQPLLYSCMIERGYERPEEDAKEKEKEIDTSVSSTTGPDPSSSKKAAVAQKGKKSTTEAMEVAAFEQVTKDIEVVSIIDCYPKPKIVHDDDDDEDDDEDEYNEAVGDEKVSGKPKASTATPSSSFEMLELEEQSTSQKKSSSSLAHLRQRREPRKYAEARK